MEGIVKIGSIIINLQQVTHIDTGVASGTDEKGIIYGITFNFVGASSLTFYGESRISALKQLGVESEHA